MRPAALRALRRVHDARADRAHAAVASRSAVLTRAEEERRREQARVASVEQQIAAGELSGAVLELRAIAALGAHRARLQRDRADLRAALAAAVAREDAARELLAQAREARGDAVRAREAVEANARSVWRSGLRRIDAAGEAAAEEVVAARWGGRSGLNGSSSRTRHGCERCEM